MGDDLAVVMHRMANTPLAESKEGLALANSYRQVLLRGSNIRLLSRDRAFFELLYHFANILGYASFPGTHRQYMALEIQRIFRTDYFNIRRRLKNDMEDETIKCVTSRDIWDHREVNLKTYLDPRNLPCLAHEGSRNNQAAPFLAPAETLRVAPHPDQMRCKKHCVWPRDDCPASAVGWTQPKGQAPPQRAQPQAQGPPPDHELAFDKVPAVALCAGLGVRASTPGAAGDAAGISFKD